MPKPRRKANPAPWIPTAADLVGLRIAKVRDMSEAEAEREGWLTICSQQLRWPAVIVLSNGTKLYPSRDPLGNGPGVLYGDHFGERFTIVFVEQLRRRNSEGQ